MNPFRTLLLLLTLCCALTGGARAADTPESGTTTYFLVRQDLRDCPTPTCGGVFVRPANRSFTKCGDGALRPECYLPQLRLPAGELDAARQAALEAALADGTLLVRGQRVAGEPSLRDVHAGGEQLLVEQAWYPEGGGAAAGVFYRVRIAATTCASASCPKYRARILNAPYSTVDIHGVVPATAPPAEPLARRYRQWMNEATPGLLVLGSLDTVHTRKGQRLVLRANRSYVPLRWQPPGTTSCYVGGCSGEVCSATANVVTTCVFKPEYACYASARCERQSTGQCGWTRSAEVLECLERTSSRP